MVSASMRCLVKILNYCLVSVRSVRILGRCFIKAWPNIAWFVFSRFRSLGRLTISYPKCKIFLIGKWPNPLSSEFGGRWAQHLNNWGSIVISTKVKSGVLGNIVILFREMRSGGDDSRMSFGSTISYKDPVYSEWLTWSPPNKNPFKLKSFIIEWLATPSLISDFNMVSFNRDSPKLKINT